jgi:hypothetical protein
LPADSVVKVIGLGGVGGIVARYLALYLASLRMPLRLVLVDGDAFEQTNFSRMFFSRHGNKAAVTRSDLAGRFAHTQLTILAIEEYVTAENVDRLIREDDIVVLAVDNHATRKLCSDFCAKRRRNVVLISGGNDGVGTDSAGAPRRGTYGNCQVYVRRGRDLSPALTRYHPEIASPADRMPGDKSCTELVLSVPQILFANLTAATAILNTFWLYACEGLHYSEMAFDIAEGLMRPAPLPPPDLPEARRRRASAPAGRRGTDKGGRRVSR